jgi:hypothetical protein
MLDSRCTGQITRRLSVISLLAVTIGACQGNTTGPVSPSGSNSVASGPGSAASPYGGHAVPLIEVAGSVPAGGTGTINATQTNRANDFEVTINVHGAPPDTDLYFQIVGDVAPATRGDGVCSPASFPAPPIHAGGDDGIIHTSAGGAGATHVTFVIPDGGILGAFEPGVKSDFKYRVVNLAQTFDLRSPCVVFTGK